MNQSTNKTPKYSTKLQGAGVYFKKPPPSTSVKNADFQPRYADIENVAVKMTSIVNQHEKSNAVRVDIGVTSSLQDYIVTRNSDGSTLSAIKKRIDVVPQKTVGPQFIKGFNWLMDHIPNGLPEIRADEELTANWMRTLDPHKQRVVQKILDDAIPAVGFHDREVFAKQEILLKPEGSAARLIHDGNPTVNVVMGGMTNALQDRMKQVLSEVNPLMKTDGICAYFPSGKTDSEIAALRARVCRGQGKMVEGDFKNNDATQPPEVRKYEALVYRKLGAPDWYTRECLAQQHISVFSRQLGLKIEVEGQRHSGEEAGTIGNTFNAVCVAIGGVIESGITNARLLVYGDDTLLWLPNLTDNVVVAHVASSMSHAAHDHGMEMEVALPTKVQATFLQSRVYDAPLSGPVPVPKLGRYLSKVNVRQNNNPDIKDTDYMAGKYLSHAFMFRHLPSIGRLFLEAASTLSPEPYIERRHKAWKPSTDPAVLRKAVVDARCLSLAEEEDCLQTIYSLSARDVQAVVANLTGSVLHRTANKPDKGYRYYDEDGPIMQQLISVDNRSVLNQEGVFL